MSNYSPPYRYLLYGLLLLSTNWFTVSKSLAQTPIATSEEASKPLCTTQIVPETSPAPETPGLSEDLPESVSVPEIKIAIDGHTATSEDSGDLGLSDFAPILQQFNQQFAGQELPLQKLEAELGKVADRITELYLNKGYITSRAISPTQRSIVRDIADDGVLTIRVIEGRLSNIFIQTQGRQRLSPSYICSRIRLGAGIPLSTAQIENQLRLLRADPLFQNIEASLQATGTPGLSNLLVRVTEEDPFTISGSADNYSPPSVGSERLGIDLSYRNLTGLGDELSGSYYFSTTGGAEVFDFRYQIPLNPMNGTVRFRAAPNRNEITEPPFDQLGIRGTQETYEVAYRQPLVRQPDEEFALLLGFAFQDGQTFVFDQLPQPFGVGPDQDGVSRTSVIKFGQEYTRLDEKGSWSLRSEFNFGTGLFDATINESPIPDSRFFSWLGQMQRVQRLSDDHLLLIQLALQLTPDSLLPAQQFVIGGGQSVRGYRQNARIGDNGFRFSVEDRVTIQRNESGAPTIQIVPFLDAGSVWNWTANPNPLPNQTLLIGGGLGLLIDEPAGLKGLTLRLDYGIPFIGLDDKGENAQDYGFYFTTRYQY